MNISLQLVLWAVGVLVFLGVIYGDVRARLKSIEGKLGENGDGVFVRKSEMALVKEAQEREHQMFREENEKLWKAIDSLIQRG